LKSFESLVKRENGLTSAEVTVHLKDGIVGRTATRLVMEARKYDRAVYIRRKDDPQQNVRVEVIISLLMLGVSKSTQLIVSVQGEDNRALRILIRFLFALSGLDSYALQFDKLDAVLDRDYPEGPE